MGILDVIKRWFGGGKPDSAKHSPASSAPQARTSAPAPFPTQVSAPPSPQQPAAPLSANEALDVIAANRAAAKPAGFVERRERQRVNARDGTRVLIIDDSPTIVALLKRMLEQNGYKTLEAMEGESGVAMAISEMPDLIFLDIVLPGMNGFEALRRLRRDPATKVTPIVMISGNELATEQFYAQRIGADDFMKKPFSRSEVFARIEKLLDAEKVPRRHLAAVKPLPVADGTVAAPAAALPAKAAAAAAAPAVAKPLPAMVAPASPAPVAAPEVAVDAAAVAAAMVDAAAVGAAVVVPVAVEIPVDLQVISGIAVSPPEFATEVAPTVSEPVAEIAVASVAEVVVLSAEPAVIAITEPVAPIGAADGAQASLTAESAELPVPVQTETVEPVVAETQVLSVAVEADAGTTESVATPATEPVIAVAHGTLAVEPARVDTLTIDETLQASPAELSEPSPLPLAAVTSITTPAAAISGLDAVVLVHPQATVSAAVSSAAAPAAVSTLTAASASTQQAASS